MKKHKFLRESEILAVHGSFTMATNMFVTIICFHYSMMSLLSLLDQTSVSAANSDKSSGACTCLHLCYVARQQVSRIVVDSIARVVYTTKSSQLLHTLSPSFHSTALINHVNKLKETALLAHA